MNTPSASGEGIPAAGPVAEAKKQSVAQACAACYHKKIRCDLATGKTTCTNCSLYNTTCQPRLRKRKCAASSPQHARRQSQEARRSSTATDHPANIGQSSPPLIRASETPATDQQIHDGRSVYFDSLEGSLTESAKAYPQTSVLLPKEMGILQAQNVFDLPSRAIKTCYIDNFFRYCYPWAPVVEPSWLQETASEKPSLLLLRAVLLAGSRVTTPNDLDTSAELYIRAKALFFSNYEPNPVIRVITCLLLRWWNPTGPDRVCMDSSQFWIRTGVGIALEIGLHQEWPASRDASFRRRLWWTVLAHDSQISGAHGRPRAIQTREFNVLTLAPRDFSPRTRDRASSSIAYMNISRIFGDIGDACRRGQLMPRARSSLANDLYVWAGELPPELRLFYKDPTNGLSPYNFESRQVHVIYFVAVLLLFRPPSPSSPVSPGSLLAASFVASIYEEFLIRDEINHLGPAIHKFFLLATGITLLSSRRYSQLRGASTEDFDIIEKVLAKFAERYPSALGTIRCLEPLKTSAQQTQMAVGPIAPLQAETRALFKEFGPGLCRQWGLIDMPASDFQTSEIGYPIDVEEQNVPTATAPTALVRETTTELHGDTGMEEATLDSLWSLTYPDLPDATSWILKDPPFSFGDDINFP